MKFLIFGDVAGRLGREGITRVLPLWRKEHAVDAVIINVENMAHGKGISPETMREAMGWKADVLVTGDHAWDNEAGIPYLDDTSIPIIRPANFGSGVPGRGYHVFQLGAYRVAVLQLQGQVLMRTDPTNPFHALDELLMEPDIQGANIILLDFHAETTSEKRGMSWHADGKISAMWGTHTHVPTADAQIMPKGTGYITDVGMVGGYHSIIGMDLPGPMRMFLTQLKTKMEPPTQGPIEINALLLDIDPTNRRTTAIAHLRKILNDKE